MSRQIPPRDSLGTFIMGLIVIAVLMLLSPGLPAQQDHTCQGGHNCNDGNGSVAVEVATGGDSTRLFSVGGSDMEISGCLATFSWLFGVRQFTKVVPDCEALQEAGRLDSEGQHEAAAKMRCGTKLYRKRFGKGQACIDAIVLTAPKSNNPEDDDEEQTRYMAQQVELDYVQEQLMILVGQVEEQKQQRVEPAVRKPTYSNEQVQAVLEIFDNEMGKN